MNTLEKKTEAIKRMKSLNLYEPIIKDFEENNIISQSEPPFGACYYVEGEQLDRIRQYEKDNDVIVYHVIRSFTNFGELESYLFVSNYKEEWEMDNEDLKQNQTFAYVYNVTTPMFSEPGYIGIDRTSAGGLKRIF